MLEKQQNKGNDVKRYNERFEFVLTTGGNIICQRYFRINSFNYKCLNSYDLVRAIRQCADIIDRDLKDKTAIYLANYAPKVFNSVEEMKQYVSNPVNQKNMHLGEGLVVRGEDKYDYAFTGDGYKVLERKFDDGELTTNSVDDNSTVYKFSFKMDKREVCSIEWTGVYPKFVRDKIDLSNKRGRFSIDDLSQLTMEQFLLHKMFEGKNDLVYGLIKRICKACSYREDDQYITEPDDIMVEWNIDSKKKQLNMLSCSEE